MVYVNGKAFVLRERDFPFRNIGRFSGIDAERVELMEQRLKTDVLREASLTQGLVLVHEEQEGEVLVPSWVVAKDVRTLREVFDQFVAEGFNVRYIRIPISAEQGPEDKYFDLLFDAATTCSPDDVLIFNCQQGGGRSLYSTHLLICSFCLLTRLLSR